MRNGKPARRRRRPRKIIRKTLALGIILLIIAVLSFLSVLFAGWTLPFPGFSPSQTQLLENDQTTQKPDSTPDNSATPTQTSSDIAASSPTVTVTVTATTTLVPAPTMTVAPTPTATPSPTPTPTPSPTPTPTPSPTPTPTPSPTPTPTPSPTPTPTPSPTPNPTLGVTAAPTTTTLPHATAGSVINGSTTQTIGTSVSTVSTTNTPDESVQSTIPVSGNGDELGNVSSIYDVLPTTNTHISLATLPPTPRPADTYMEIVRINLDQDVIDVLSNNSECYLFDSQVKLSIEGNELLISSETLLVEIKSDIKTLKSLISIGITSINIQRFTRLNTNHFVQEFEEYNINSFNTYWSKKNGEYELGLHLNQSLLSIIFNGVCLIDLVKTY